MKKYSLRLQGDVIEDIENVKIYKGRNSTVAPSRIISKILSRLADLQTMPRAGRVSNYDPDYRQIFVEDYTVFYLVDEERKTIQVDFILHQSRNIAKIIRTGDRSFDLERDHDDDHER